jgi:F-type H+-transporting ATPase subunit epsilon
MATIQVDIVSAEGEIHSGEAAMVFAPAKMGEIGIAPRHAPLLTGLKPGEVRVQDTEGNEHFFYITGGMRGAALRSNGSRRYGITRRPTR